MHESIECAHDLCNCTLTAQMQVEEYCSQSCKDAQQNGIETETCSCGHPQCDVP
ncbi:MAG TPA: hypothetical protein VIO32_05335 [Candidatus Baltobacteraceae bacterium]